ncbi:peptide methionine sulfoxide reductase MsrB-like [Montipora foliosa]|uniref:peptide methionine sulfoxide reductase MsrB-like n=1 Tax=Montipora foliosa TaxID=591990 RepID=UPI0035F1CC43
MAARRLWKGLEICQSYVTVISRDKFNLLKTLSARSQDTKNPGLRICARGICFYQAAMVKNSDVEWKAKLTPEQFWVCRQKGTEPPWSGEYVDLKTKGIYTCVCCGSALFSSSSKFDSGTGWPSFHSALEMSSDDKMPAQLTVVEKSDNSHGMVRVEVLCRKCDSHLGHVFPDGPPPTGLRYCINSISLKFQAED